MKNKEQIINDSIKLETPPADYNLLEIHCFLALKQLVVMFHNKQITTENATKTKQLILANYEKRCKEYEFQTSMFQEHIDHIKNTEAQRIRLNKMLNGKDEELKKIPFEEGLCQSLNLAVEILDTVFKGEFINGNSESR